MAKLIIIRGNSGSGKTTVAKALQEKFGHNTMLISQDEVRRDILKVKDGIDTKALPIMKELLIYGYNHCKVVILEGILNAEWYKSLFELAKEKFAGDIFAYYYDLGFEETLKRHQTKPNRDDFGEENMRRWWREKDYMKIIPEKILTKESGIQTTVELIYQDAINYKYSIID